MRDFNRIRKVCSRLATAWESVPDLRLGQLLEVVQSDIKKSGRDPFYSEDDDFAAAIEKVCERLAGGIAGR